MYWHLQLTNTIADSKMMLIISIWILMTTIPLSTQECTSTIKNEEYVFQCKNTSQENFMYDFFHIYANTKNSKFSYELTILDSDFIEINAFRSPLPEYMHLLKTLRMTNCQIKSIDEYAFEDIPCESLDLGNNKLQNLSFVRTLPGTIRSLYLNDNLFRLVTDEFINLPFLEFLDLTNCKINKIGLNSFSSLSSAYGVIKLGKNELSSFDTNFHSARLDLDLSFNNLKRIDCQGIQSFGILDLSFININNSNHINFLNPVGTLNLANSDISDFNFELFKIVKGSLKLTGNNLRTLTPNLFANNQQHPDLILSNASINNIEANAFMSSNFACLNISHNPLGALKDFIFNETYIEILDVSNCLLQAIETNAFYGLYLHWTLDLSHNHLTYLNRNVFHNLKHVKRIDLSFNILKKLDNNLFKACVALFFLNLADSRIEVIRGDTFMGLENLIELKLQNNLIERINFHISTNLAVIDLRNNSLSHLQLSSFHNLKTNEMLLSGNKIHILHNSTQPQIQTKNLDLSECKIYRVEPDSFKGFSKLENLTLRANEIEKIDERTFTPLKNLLYLDLTGNRITYISPAAFAFGNKLHHLEINFLETNLISRPFTRINYLDTLTISNSNFSLLDANFFKGLVYLKNLILHNVAIKSIAPNAFSGLNSLTQIDSQIFKNIVIITLDVFQGLGNIEILNLSNLKIRSIHPKSFSGLLNLKKLFLNNNSLTKIGDNSFWGLGLITVLNLSNNHISVLEKDAFSGLNNLRNLSLNNNLLKNFSLGTFQNFPLLSTLYLSRNNISTLLTGTFSNLKNLITLDLSYNNITVLKIETLFTLTNLRILHLSGNHMLEITHLELIKSLRHLEFIGINNNRWKCNDLTSILIAFQNYTIQWESDRNPTFDHENIDGIKCIDICKFFYCPEHYILNPQTE